MIAVLQWYLLINSVGWISFPIIYSYFNNLPDRGYSLSKAFGLLICGFLYWIGNNFQLINNSSAGIFVCIFFTGLFSCIFWRGSRRSIKLWVKRNITYIIILEFLFICSLLFIITLRIADPNVSGTEKPMELAFINSILRSPNFPPNDPWLAGYSISYYYFGYAMVAMLAKVFSTSGSTAFNLGVSFWFSLITISVYGLSLNIFILYLKHKKTYRPKYKKRLLLLCLLTPMLLLIVSNAEGILEIFHSRGLFWKNDLKGGLQSEFWSYLDIKELNEHPPLIPSWKPERPGGIWWWRASRIITDYDVVGNQKEIINEFPFFSFYLADLHPHVLALPFVVLAISVSLNIFSEKQANSFQKINDKKLLIFWHLITSLMLGSILFLNTWDFLIYFGLFAITIILRYYLDNHHEQKFILEPLKTIMLNLGLLIGMYSPFLLGFSSQAGGILPSLNYFTRGIHFWTMFFPLLIPLLVFIFLINNKIPPQKMLKSLLYSILIVALLWITSNIFAFILANRIGPSLRDIHGGLPINILLVRSNLNRLRDPITLITITLLMAGSFSFMLQIISRKNNGKKKFNEMKEKFRSSNDPRVFIVLLLILGLTLILFPEFFYLKDVFNTRMNTIFKFYFQAWLLFSIVSSFVMITIFLEVKKQSIQFAFLFIIVIGLITGLIYPFFAIQNRLKNLEINALSLDGLKYLAIFKPDEYEAIQFISKLPFGYIVEAVGGSYSGFARISMATGLPTVLGWPGHELQWRGGVNEIGSREYDVEQIYSTTDWEVRESLLEQYNIRYIYLGDLEERKYDVNLENISEHLLCIFKNDSIQIFEYR